ncbi:amidohydrolase family protein [Inquilinus sp.]|uniref:amidohydrolase family protein n=1 Tax=Inquilinus sp. TaxID=1932117 RepID=UPI0037847232
MHRPYDGPIVDAHHHLWDLSMDCHPWLRPARGEMVFGDNAPLRRDYLPTDYRSDARNQRVVATVHVEASWDPADPVAETAWLESLDDRRGIAARYVAHVALDSPDAAALLERQAAFPRVVGIRDILSWHPDPARSFVDRPDRMDDPAWRGGLARLAGLGLSFDLMIYPGQMADALRLVRDFPGQIFILNHCGSPADRDPEGMARWRAGLAALGREPNVHLKISDLVAYDHHWTPESLRAVVLTCLDAFGPARSLFASDFPVAGLHAAFDHVWDGFKAFTADLAPAEQRALFHDNARRLYRIG